MTWRTITRWIPSRIQGQLGASLVFFISLVTLAVGYVLLGFITLLFDTTLSYPVDLRLRWIEQGMIYQGLNPQDLTYPEHLLPDLVKAQRNVRGSYPPWSYATGMVLVPPVEWSMVRVYFAMVNVVALALLGYWSFGTCARCGNKWALVAVASVLAIFSVCVCLSYGQYSVVVVTFLVACLVLLQRGQMAAAGVCLGVAAVKPHLAGLFFLIPAIYPYSLTKKFRFFVAAGVFLALSSWCVAAFVGSSPWDMVRSTFTESVQYYHLSNNPALIWSAEMFGFPLGSKLLALFVACICGILLLAARRQDSLLTGFSICAILSLYWSYSRHYDLVILAIPLVQLLWLWRTKRSTWAALAFLLLASLLWCPIRIEMSRWPSIELLHAGACLIALATIVMQRRLGHAPRETTQATIESNALAAAHANCLAS
jgi:hypothetical protein